MRAAEQLPRSITSMALHGGGQEEPMMVAGVITGVTGARAGRWVSGPSSTKGAMYGISWSIACRRS